MTTPPTDRPRREGTTPPTSRHRADSTTPTTGRLPVDDATPTTGRLPVNGATPTTGRLPVDGLAPTTGRLGVDGATLHYEVRGSGPLVLLIPGGTGGAASFDAVADRLATAYTVASYDPRGLTRSPLDDPDAPQRVEQHAEDAYRLLDLLSPDAPARVAGCSSGAITALHLLATHPGRVQKVVAHEPPLLEVLPDAPQHRALLIRVQDTLQREGLMPAAAIFAAGLQAASTSPESPAGLQAAPTSPEPPADPDASHATPTPTPAGGSAGGLCLACARCRCPGRPFRLICAGICPGCRGRTLRLTCAGARCRCRGRPFHPSTSSAVPVERSGLPPEAAARVERTMGDMPYFLGRIVPSFMGYVPDLDRLQALSERLVLAGGVESRGEVPYRPAAVMAERFGTELVHFPGGHTGLSTHPDEFGELLAELLR
ncbi:alpha/beta hydrolase [Nonomuraea salmonea]|uniref:alpha/beta hydrolase n=1 Tax=Nonomuraea salmonea TaxID=46181 RepID=UPI002FE8CDFF